MPDGGGIKYRYYLSSALLLGRPKQAGSVSRVPTQEVETVAAQAVREHLKLTNETQDAELIDTHVVRGRGPIGSVVH